MKQSIMIKLVTAVVLVVLAYFVYVAVTILSARSVGMRAVAQTSVFEVDRGPGAPRVLIVGDSTAVGVGASEPGKSIAGLIARDYPVTIVNRAVSGAKIEDVVEQLRSAEGTYTLVLIQAGANDVLYLTAWSKVDSGIRSLVAEALQKSGSVVLLTAGNIGLAPVLPWPLGPIMTERTLHMRSLMSGGTAVRYVDLFKSKGEDPFESDMNKYYAPDHLHLSDDGYAYWYSEIERQAKLSELLQKN